MLPPQTENGLVQTASRARLPDQESQIFPPVDGSQANCTCRQRAFCREDGCNERVVCRNRASSPPFVVRKSAPFPVWSCERRSAPRSVSATLSARQFPVEAD